LSAPIIVLLICLPLLRPLRHPDPRLVSDDEQARLATIQAVVEQHTLEIQNTNFFATRDVIKLKDRRGYSHWFSDQSPTMSYLLSGPYWVMHHCGLTFDHNPILVEYLLTLLGVTLPIALATGLLYRMGRLFELPRPRRAALALAVVIGSGWISYATVLSSGAAAAALVVTSAACLVQATLTQRRVAAYAWVAISGLCAALAGTYELTALAFLVFLLGVVCVFRWPVLSRLGAISLYVGAATVPLLMYATLTRSITGDLRPGFLHPELSHFATNLHDDQKTASDPNLLDDDDDAPSFWRPTWRNVDRFFTSLIGSHGVLTHFPVLIFGLIGVSMVMHRHWPATTKVLAGATLLAALGIIIGYTLQRPDWSDAMFANRWFLVFMPLVLFWAGAWLRRSHHPATWATAAALWTISAAIALLGATDPQPRQGYNRYSAAGALVNLIHPPEPPRQQDMIAASPSF
jgi:hypothetical protein